MLIQLQLNPSMAKCHSISDSIPGKSLGWNGSKYELEFQKRNGKKTSSVILLLAFGSALYALNSYTALKSGDLGMSIISGYFSVIAALAGITLPLFRDKLEDCVDYLNGLLEFADDWKNDQEFQRTIQSGSSLVKLICQTLTTIQMTNPWLLTAVAGAWPCSPLNMFSIVNPSCTDISRLSPSHSAWMGYYVSNLGSVLVHLIFWKGVYSQGVIDCMHIFLGSLCQKKMLKYLIKRLDEAAGNGNPFHLNLYRTLQLLNNYFNNYSAPILFLVVATLTTTEVMTTVLTINIIRGSYSNLPVLIKVFVVEVCPVVFVFHMAAMREAASVHNLSLTVFRKAKRRDSEEMKRNNIILIRRYMRSASSLKVKLGQNNFIEGNTALVMMDFTLRRVVDLLLVDSQ